MYYYTWDREKKSQEKDHEFSLIKFPGINRQIQEYEKKNEKLFFPHYLLRIHIKLLCDDDDDDDEITGISWKYHTFIYLS